MGLDLRSPLSNQSLARPGLIPGELKHKRGAVWAGFLDRYLPLVFLDDAVNRAQAQAGALAKFLGGEKRVEYLGQMVFRDAAAGVGNFQADNPIFLIQAGLQRQGSLFFHGIHGVDYQVDDHLGHLVFIHLDEKIVPIVLFVQLDI